jgi:Zn-dependent protease
MELADAIKWYIVFLFSTSFHEAAHAWTAWKLGDDTAFRGGQATLDPTPHIRREPMGMVVVPIASYFIGGWMIGWASAPYNVAWALANPRRAGLMAIAGPAANLALVILAAIAIRVGVAFHYFQAPAGLGFMHMTDSVDDGFPEFAAKITSIVFSLNLLLGAFNLLPIPPLDGSSLPLLFSSPGTAEAIFRFMRQPALRLVGMFIAWKFFGQVFNPILLFAGRLLYPGVFYP